MDIPPLKASLGYMLLRAEPDELFFRCGSGGFFHLTQHGILTMMGLTESERNELFQKLLNGQGTGSSPRQLETFSVTLDPEAEYEVDFDHLILNRMSDPIAELILIEMSESAGLHYFRKEADILLEETRAFTAQMESSGRIAISNRELKIFLGRALNLKGRIVENLYLFDTPSVAWKDEFLNQLDKDLTVELELHQRYRAIQDKLDIITENLGLFKDLLQHRHSSWLEWIIIILILIEVIDMFVLKLL